MRALCNNEWENNALFLSFVADQPVWITKGKSASSRDRMIAATLTFSFITQTCGVSWQRNFCLFICQESHTQIRYTIWWMHWTTWSDDDDDKRNAGREGKRKELTPWKHRSAQASKVIAESSIQQKDDFQNEENESWKNRLMTKKYIALKFFVLCCRCP